MKQNGFTLIELMITIVIIAILAGIAVPQYLAYTKRAEAAELVALADIVKKKVGIFYSTKGRWPDESNTEDTEDIVGLALVLGKFGVSADNEEPDGSKVPFAQWYRGKWSIDEAEARVVATKEWDGTPGDAARRWGVLVYVPETSQGALTWSCTWYGDAGAKPDGCE